VSRSSTGLQAWRRARADAAAARDELAVAEAEAGLRPRGDRRLRLVLTAALTVALVLAAVAVWQAVVRTPEFTDRQIVDAARDRTRLLLTADAGDADRARQILAGATGEFHDSFAQSAEAYTQYIEKAGSRGEVRIDAATLARRGDPDSVVLIVASLKVGGTGVSADAAGTQQLRLRVVVTPDDGVLKLSGVGFVE